jgi:hypothetical protein
MIKDAEENAGVSVEEYLGTIARASLKSGYRLVVRKKGLELELLKAVDD